jgi:hypothetical protein
MESTVYFNFPEITLEGTVDVGNQIALNDNRVTNIKYKDINYSAHDLYITDVPGGEPNYLIIKCLSDINNSESNYVYVVIPLIQSDPNDKNRSDIDNIIDKPISDTISKFELNKYIKDYGKCNIFIDDSSPVTISLGLDSAIPIQSYKGTKTFYGKDKLVGININTPQKNGTANGSLKKQDMDWIMSCELLTEDGPTEKKKVDPGSTATTITLFLMVIMVSGCAYIGGPIIYTELGMFKMAEQVLGGNHYSINIYCRITLFFVALLCLIQGSIANGKMLLFMSMALVLSYFAGTKGVLKIQGVSNMKGDDFATTKSPLQVYSALVSGDCYSLLGRIAKFCLLAILIGLFGGLIEKMAKKQNKEFSGIIISYLVFSALVIPSIYYFNTSTTPPK